MSFKDITYHLQSLADPEFAAQFQRFFKTAEGQYGFGDKFLGIRVPVIRKTLRQYKETPLSVVSELIKSEFHEVRQFAVLMLVTRFCEADNKEKKAIYQLYLENTQTINNWDLVDCSAHYIVGAYLEDKDRSILYKLLKSESLWERRIAIISTYHFIRINQFADTLKIAKELLDDKEDLIHKAVGWMLREIGKRDLATEVKFLKVYYQKMPRTMLRYSIEKFPENVRKKYLLGKI